MVIDTDVLVHASVSGAPDRARARAALSLHGKHTVITAGGLLCRFHLRGREKIATEWLVVALAYNCRRLCRLQAA
jgi:hypothetical protein